MKKYLWMLCALFLLITGFYITSTYGLLEKNTSGSSTIPVAQWVIKLNGNNISQVKTITLNDMLFENGEHTEANYFAPGSKVYYNLLLDASESDVAVSYTIDIDTSKLSQYPNIKATVEKNNVTTSENTFTGVIKLDDLSNTINLKIALEWLQDDTLDSNDSLLAGEQLPITITAHFEQYIE